MASRFPHRISQLDLDRLHCAKEILLQDLETPPSLLEAEQALPQTPSWNDRQ